VVKIPFDRLESAIKDEDYVGFCLECGDEAYNVEPDARNYKCESCEAHQVFGAQEILIMGEYE
jgi:Zn finger protein HypA/HybF involved in hydrogenase expression